MPTLPEVVVAHRDDILTEWVLVQRDPAGGRDDRLSDLVSPGTHSSSSICSRPP